MKLTKALSKTSRFAVSAVLAASLTAGAAPVAWAAQAAQTAQAATTFTRAQDAAKADAYDQTKIDSFTAACKKAGVSDANVKTLETYLQGKQVTADDFNAIKADALPQDDKTLVKEIKDKQAALAKAAADQKEQQDQKNAQQNAGTTTPAAPAQSTDQPAAQDQSAQQQPAAAEQPAAAAAAQPAAVTDQPTDATTDGTLSNESSSQSGEAYVPGSVTPNPSTREFIASIAEQARTVGQEHDLYASVMIAQAVLESGSGSSVLSRAPYYNLFGIKGSYQGQSVTMSTSEDDGSGNRYSVDAAFRRYPSAKESLEDYADLLTNVMATFYAPVRKSNAPTFVDACNYLQGHYATDTSYSAKLQDIINAYGLTAYDDPADAAAAAAAEGAAATEAFDDDSMDQANATDAALIAEWQRDQAEDGNGGDAEDQCEDAADNGTGPLGTIVPGAAAVALATAANRRMGPFRRDPALDMAKTLPIPAAGGQAARSVIAPYETIAEDEAAEAASVEEAWAE